jgi:hypothetical protein
MSSHQNLRHVRATGTDHGDCVTVNMERNTRKRNCIIRIRV